MVNAQHRPDDSSDGNVWPRDPERILALHYVPRGARQGIAALFALDETLGDIVRTTREPLIGQMRLTWWHEALGRLDTGRLSAGPPVLIAIADALGRHPSPSVGAPLARMIDGWEVLLDEGPLGDESLLAHALARGSTLFRAAAALLGGTDQDRVASAGRGWALVDLALHLRDPIAAARALALAQALLASAFKERWPTALRPIGMLARLAARDALGGAVPRRQGSPARISLMVRHRMTGR